MRNMRLRFVSDKNRNPFLPELIFERSNKYLSDRKYAIAENRSSYQMMALLAQGFGWEREPKEGDLLVQDTRGRYQLFASTPDEELENSFIIKDIHEEDARAWVSVSSALPGIRPRTSDEWTYGVTLYQPDEECIGVVYNDTLKKFCIFGMIPIHEQFATHKTGRKNKLRVVKERHDTAIINREHRYAKDDLAEDVELLTKIEEYTEKRGYKIILKNSNVFLDNGRNRCTWDKFEADIYSLVSDSSLPRVIRDFIAEREGKRALKGIYYTKWS